jgi:hypothetical protein
MKLLSFVPFVLCNLMAADNGGGSGSSPAAPAAPTKPSWAPGDKAPELTGDSLESKNTSATGIIGALFANLKAAFTDFSSLQTEKNNLETQFNELKQTAQAEKDAHAETKNLLQVEKDAHTKTTGKLEKSEKNVERLESLCDLKGIDKNQAVKPNQAAAGATGSTVANEYLDLKKKEAAGEVKRGTASRFYSKNKKEIDAAIAE